MNIFVNSITHEILTIAAKEDKRNMNAQLELILAEYLVKHPLRNEKVNRVAIEYLSGELELTKEDKKLEDLLLKH